MGDNSGHGDDPTSACPVDTLRQVMGARVVME